MKRPPRPVLIVLIIVFGTGWIWRQRTETTRSRPDSAAVVAVTSRTAGTSEELLLGKVLFRGCQIGQVEGFASMQALCAKFEVPENPEQPDGRRIELRIALVKSRAAKPEPDLVTLLDGGPGGAATEDYVSVSPAFAEIRRRRHVLLIDQRGTGGSNPLRCDDRDADDASVVEAQAGTGDHAAIDREAVQQELQQCLARLAARADVRWYRTTDAVRDLEAVRQALGAPQLNLVGVSYGTRVAQQYARAHPDAVRSIVLDSPVPNRLALGSEHARNLEDALRARFAVCTRDAECSRRFGDPYASLYRLRDQLRERPRQASARDPLTHEVRQQVVRAADLAGTVRLFSYDASTAALLPLTIDEALRGNLDPLLGQEKLIMDALRERLTDGVGLSVSCAEDADRMQPDPAQANTLLGNSLVEFLLAGCEVWPHAGRPAQFDAPLQSALPVLVLAGEFDPVTPARYGEEIVAALPNARLLLARGQGHAVMGGGCMPKLLAAFIVAPDPKQLDAGCLAALGDVAAFVNFSGAGP